MDDAFAIHKHNCYRYHSICRVCMDDAFGTHNNGAKFMIFSGDDEIPYVIGGLIADGAVFKISVEEARWCKSYKPPGLGHGHIAPEKNFLVISALIKNHGTQSLTIPRSLPPVFTLLDEHGAEHAVSANPAFAGRNLTRKVLSGHAIHPKLPLTGELVFDVHEGNYFLVVSRGVLEMNGCVKRACDIGRYRLTPQACHRMPEAGDKNPANSDE